MQTGAFRDYTYRFREAVLLLRIALLSSIPATASAAAKGATVLAAAALERFINDAINQACRRISARSWDDLPEGQKKYLCQLMARRMSNASQVVLDANDTFAKKQQSFRKATEECLEGFSDPSAWDHHPEYGLFSDAKAEPDRLDRILRNFDPQDRSFYEFLSGDVSQRAEYLNALKQLIDARHGVAHALPASTPPWPTDVKSWLVASFWLARRIEAFLLGTVTRSIGEEPDPNHLAPT